MKVAVLIPEWPGQTHIWMWREFEHLRRLGLDLAFYSTRPPPPANAARHAFAEQARGRTMYLWPLSARSVLQAAACAVRHPVRCARAAGLAAVLRDRHGRHSLHNLGLLAVAFVLAEHIAGRECRHLYVHSAADSALIARFAGLISGVPYSVVVNASLEWWGGSLDQKLGRAAAVFAHARWIRDDILKSIPTVAAERLVLAPIGVDVETWPFGPRRAVCTPPLRLISVGRLHPAKGHAVVIRAVERLRTLGRDVGLKILGGGPQHEELAALIRSLKLEEHVELLGSVSEDRVQAELSASDIFVLASEWEALGVVYMEAMAAGVPVVATREGGVSEIVDHGRTGLLVDPKSIDAIVEAIVRFANDDAFRTRVVRAARASIEERYDCRVGARRVYEAIRDHADPNAVAAHA